MCQKELSSKQNVECHIKTFHPERDSSDANLHTRILNNSGDKDKGRKDCKKKAYNSFKGLKSMFSDPSLCEKFDLWSKSESSVNGNSATDLDKGDNILHPVSDETENAVKSFKEMSSSASVDIEECPEAALVSGNSMESLTDSNLDTSVLRDSRDNTIESDMAPAVESSSSLTRQKGSSNRFVPPFKIRGNCGCENCMRQPCGSCCFCINKKAKYVYECSVFILKSAIFRQRRIYRRCTNLNKKLKAKITDIITNSQENVDQSSSVEHEVMETCEVNNNLTDQESTEDVSTDDAFTRDSTNAEVAYQVPNDAIMEKPSNGVPSYSCQKCGKVFQRKIYATKHCREKYPWKCSRCGQLIAQSQNINRHKRRCENTKKRVSKTKGRVFSCDICDKSYTFKCNLERHLAQIHEVSKEATITCDVSSCNFRTNKKDQLKRHWTLVHSEKAKIACTLCSMEFRSDSGFKKHILEIHRIECNYCEESFPNTNMLDRHRQRVHQGASMRESNVGIEQPIVRVSRVLGHHSQVVYRSN